eukprot:g456.t1
MPSPYCRNHMPCKVRLRSPPQLWRDTVDE